MFYKLLTTLLLGSLNIFPSVTNEPNVVNSNLAQVAGDKIEINQPLKLVSANLAPVVTARAALVVDEQTQKILFEKNINEQLPIASITKLMSAMVFLDQNPDLKQIVSLSRQDEAEGGRLYLRVGEQITLENIFNSALIASANNATLALVRFSGLSKNEFISHMNRKADELGMEHTHFVEATGLSEHNLSTATDLTRLLTAALNYPQIKQALSVPTYSFNSDVQEYKIHNTNTLLNDPRFEVLFGKTGYIDEAGYCLITFSKIKGQPLITVVLNAAGGSERFSDTRSLLFYTEQNYQWN